MTLALHCFFGCVCRSYKAKNLASRLFGIWDLLASIGSVGTCAGEVGFGDNLSRMISGDRFRWEA